VRVTREQPAGPEAVPPYLVWLYLHFDLTAAGVYVKHSSTGDVLPSEPGCPDPEGCYYT